MRPEEKAEIILWDWLITKSNYIKKTNIFFNHKNEVGCDVFKVEGSQKKPDLLVNYNDGWGNKVYAIEVKDNSKSQNILKGSKIIDLYFQNYIQGKTKYKINNKIIKIDGFLIASQSSIKGHLFKKEELLDNFEGSKTSSKYIVSKKYKIIPRWEGHRTFEFIRMLWNEYGKIRNDHKEKCSLGILIGNKEENFNPYIMITDYNKNTKQWSQRWWKI